MHTHLRLVVVALITIITACSGDRALSDVTQVVDYIVQCDSVTMESICIGPTSQWARYPHTVIISTNEVRSLGEGRGIGPLQDCKVKTPYEWTCWSKENQIVLRNGTVTEGLYSQGLSVVSKLDWCFANRRPGESSSLKAKLLCTLLQ
jgi:hypothetical protein